MSRDKLRTILCPVPSKEDESRLSPIISIRRTLLKSQNLDGSWGNDNTLDRLVTTCHVMMFLVAAGASPSSRAFTSGTKWLTSEEVLEHNNSYWLIGPLGAIPGQHRVIVEQQFEKLRAYIETHSTLHPNQSFEAFYLHAARAAQVEIDDDFRRKCVAWIKSIYNKERGWTGHPATTVGCYVVLSYEDPKFATSIRPQVIKLLKGWAASEDHNRISWGSPIVTAYCIMNIAESDLFDDLDVRELFEKAVAHLLHVRDGLHWRSAMPYGGTGDIKSLEYPTAAVGRALVASLLVTDVAGARASISAAYVAALEAKLFQWRWVWFTTIMSIGAFSIYRNWQAFPESLAAVWVWLVENWATCATIIGLVVGVIAFFNPKLGPRLLSRLQLRWKRRSKRVTE